MLISKTKSVCPECLKMIDAEKVQYEDGVWIEKYCEEHGQFRALLWKDLSKYNSYTSRSIKADRRGGQAEMMHDCSMDCGICDSHRGGICTAVLEITERCNMQCPICFASASPDCSNDMSLEEAERRLRRLYERAGACSLQLSGGEVTLRNDLPEFIKLAKNIGFGHVQVNSNGIRISHDIEYLKEIKAAGCDVIYLQFDGLDDKIYHYTRGRDMLDIKMKAIANCEQIGIGVMLVPVIINGVNEHAIGEIIDFATAKIPVVKGIHFQPVSFFGRFPEEDREKSRYTLDMLINAICDQTEIEYEQIAPRAKYSPMCSFSAAFYRDKYGDLVSFGTSKKTEEAKKPAEPMTENMEAFAYSTNKYTRRFWAGEVVKSDTEEFLEKGVDEATETDWQDLIFRLKHRTLSISSMAFQDVWNIDVDRLESCCVMVCGKDGEVPLCLYHLTSTEGEMLYGE